MNDSFFRALVDDGRPLLKLVALVLLGAGAFTSFQAATGHFLPHDTEYLGMTAKQLCSLHQCRIVHFMIHDRISFGGVLIAIAAMYFWLIEFPLRRGEGWAWWALLVSGSAGFLSFLTYLGYGYLDTWHGLSTLVLLPLYVWGMIKTRALIRGERGWRALLVPGARMSFVRLCLVLSTFGIAAAGLTIMTVGMTRVFVPTDLEFMGLDVARIRSINANLVPLIAHDRAGFGGALVSVGLAMFLAVWCAPLSRSLWQALALSGVVGFSAAILVHPAIGYTDFFHLAPAVLGAGVFFLGLALALLREPFRAAAGMASS
jgi:hypothetical protein